VFPTRRLTTAQALVAFLAAQEVEWDGARWPFFAGVYGTSAMGMTTAADSDMAARWHQRSVRRAARSEGARQGRDPSRRV